MMSMIIHCRKCGKIVSRSASFRARMKALRYHYLGIHGGWKRPITKDRRYKNPGKRMKIPLSVVCLVNPCPFRQTE